MNKKVFKRINIIDLIVILVLVFAVAAAGVFFVRSRKNQEIVTEQTSLLVVKFYTEEVSDFVADKLEVGATLFDADKEVDMGSITNFEIGNAIVYGGIDAGSYEVVHKEGYKSVTITGEVQGVKNATGALIGGEQYGVGHSMTLRAGDAKIYLRVYDIGVKSDVESVEKETAQKQKKIEVTYETNEVKGYIADSIKVGDKLADMSNGIKLGTITSVDVDAAKVYVETAGGNIVVSDKPGYNSIVIKGEVNGEILENGVLRIGNKEYNIGKEFVLSVGNVMVHDMGISKIEIKQ